MVEDKLGWDSNEAEAVQKQRTRIQKKNDVHEQESFI